MTDTPRSERLSTAAPLSYRGSAQRIWRRLTWDRHVTIRWALQALAAALVGLAWLVVTGWYVLFGLLVVPWRVLIGRRRRRRKVEDARHREHLSAVDEVRAAVREREGHAA